MNSSKAANAKPGGGGDEIPLYDLDELDLLRDELLEAYSTPREKLHTRDEEAAIRRSEFTAKGNQKHTLKNQQDESTMLKLKAKQDALRRLYENVVSEKTQGKKRRSKSSKSSFSSASFHKMYTVYHDPTKGGKAKYIEGKEPDDDDDDEESDAISSVKIMGGKGPPPPSKKEEPDKLTDADGSSAKERSKFVLKQRLSSLTPKPPPLVEGMKLRTSRDMRYRDDTRYSEGKDRYSFDVDVVGPILNYYDPRRPTPRMRTIATQAMLADDVRTSQDYGDMGSQTEFDIISFRGSKRDSKSTGRGSDFFDEEEDEEDFEDLAGGDASSSNPSEIDEDEVFDDSEEGKTLERKESKRREAETMARPRGYRDLDLREELPFVTFEAETNVTAHDLEREEARQRGFTLSRDNILWPRCSEFDMDTAAKKIEEYIKRCWHIDPKWLFYIQPLEVYHDSYRKKYVFEVKFSVPSPTTPVPPATASVFFVFEIPIYSIEKDDTVKVTYVLEGSRFPHHPGKIPFQDKWLWGIVSDKQRVQKAVNL